MRPQLQARATRQRGLVTRQQAVEAGYRERELRTLTAVRGAWVVVRRGVYVEREIWEAAGHEYDEQDRLRDLAAHLCMVTPHLMSHDSAARAWRLPLLRPRHALSHITRTGVGGSRTEHGVKHHLTRHALSAEVADTMPATALPRTVVDLAREHGWLTGTAATDAALRRGVRQEDLAAELLVMRSWPGITQARAACELADAGADTPVESVGRVLIQGLGLGRPATQFPVWTPSATFWVDLRIGRHLFEIDGRVKYRGRERGGVADRPVEDVLFDERQRQHVICAQGFGMSRIDSEELWPPRRTAMLERVRQEYDVTLQRFGSALTEEMVRFEQRMSAERRRRIYGRSAPAA